MRVLRPHGGGPPGVIDFSIPMNPLEKPRWVSEVLRECASVDRASRYVEPGLDPLREAVERLSGLRGWAVVPLNGSAEALALVPLVYRAPAVAVVEPSFGDHHIQSRVWRSRLVRICSWQGGSLRLPGQPPHGAIVVVGWPNNPTGQVLGQGDMRIVEEAAADGGLLVVDEAFQPLSKLDHYTSRIAPQLTLWTPTKALGLPGLRLGAAASREWEVVEPLELARQPWPVDSVTHCFYTRLAESYLGDALKFIAEGRRVGLSWVEEASKMLAQAGLEVYRSLSVFMLVRHRGLRHPALNKALASIGGVYVRDASTFHCLGPEYSRVAARSPAETSRLVEAFRRLGAVEWGLETS